jgi:hypothetical protein
VRFDAGNYMPFHFAVSLITEPGWEAFLAGKNLLLACSVDPRAQAMARKNLEDLGASSVNFLPVSPTSAMTDRIDLNTIERRPDVILVAAGIGSANIIRQLEPLETLTVDIGGFINCIVDPAIHAHAGSFVLPVCNWCNN